MDEAIAATIFFVVACSMIAGGMWLSSVLWVMGWDRNYEKYRQRMERTWEEIVKELRDE